MTEENLQAASAGIKWELAGLSKNVRRPSHWKTSQVSADNVGITRDRKQRLTKIR